MKLFTRIMFILLFIPLFTLCNNGTSSSLLNDNDKVFTTNERWVCSINLSIAVNSSNSEPVFLTSGSYDYKPVWSKTGSMITFFRVTSYNGTVSRWKTAIHVINADGTGLRKLTSGAYSDFNPTWTRDGSNKIIFNRVNVDSNPASGKVYIISPTGNIGDEQLISDPSHFDFAYSGLIDGRIFVDRLAITPMRSFLLSPVTRTYEEIQRSTIKPWHKVSISPGETRIAFMLDFNDDINTYADSVLYYADFDKANLVISNFKAITASNPDSIEEYPRWSSDESLIIYDSDSLFRPQAYAYRLSDGVTSRLSDWKADYNFGCFENTPQ